MFNIIFKKLPLQENINIINWCLNDNDTSLDKLKYTQELFPNINKNNYIDIITSTYKQQEQDIENSINYYTKIWNKYNDTYFNTLLNYLDISLPSKTIICYIGILPISPRNLDDYSFYTTINLKESNIIEICAHESLHFIWFNKFKTIYKDIDSKEYNAPYLPWIYSEMVTDPILNSLEIQNVFNNTFKEKSYDTFYKIDNGNIMNNIIKIYKENISINNKIIKGYEYLLKNYNL